MSPAIAVCTFGTFEEESAPSTEYLTIVFSPSSVPLRDRWRTHRLSASFLADYFSTFFPGEGKPGGITDPRSELVGSITFIANELIENAMKFSPAEPLRPIMLTLQLYPEKLVFLTQNCTQTHAAEQFQQYIRTLLSADLMSLYIATMEHNAAHPSSNSGLGLLTILNDYTAKAGWQFESLNNEQTLVTTQVQLAVYR